MKHLGMHLVHKHLFSAPTAFLRLGSVLLAVLLASMLSVSPAMADTPPDPEAEGLKLTERLDRLIERIKYEQANLQSMQATFEQRKESELLLEPEVSTGTFWYRAPDRVRWDFMEPNDTRVVITDDTMLTWYRDLGRAEQLNVGGQTDRVMQYLSASNSLETLQQYFDIQVTFPKDADAPFRLEMKPSFKRVEKRIKSMGMNIHRTGYYPTYLRYEEPNGDLTELHFNEVVVNETIADDVFTVALPDGIEVRTVELDKKKRKKARKQRD